MPWVSLKQVKKSIDNKTILNNINLDIIKGEMIALLGPSGCGKSTTLRVMAGITSCDSGDIYIAENKVNNLHTSKTGAVLVFQDYLLFPHMTVEKNIAFGLKAKKVDKSIINQKVSQLIETVELVGQEKKYPYQLSGGQQQRVAIARALAVSPDILLLDEPFSNLDPILRDSMQQFVKDIHKKTGTTTVIVTHSKEEAFRMSDRVAVMFQGEIVQVDTPHNLYTRPKTVKVAEFLGSVNSIKARVDNGISHSVYGSYTLNKANGNYKIGIRPEDIELVGDNKGVITDVQFMGDKFKITISCGEETIIAQNHWPQVVPKIGDDINFNVNFTKAVYTVVD